MSTLVDLCEEHFHTDNLYEVLGVRKCSSKQELKKGYYKRSLTCHPDRVSSEDKERATVKFQVLGKVYAILSNDESRLEYDETGTVGEEMGLDLETDFAQYWRLLFPKVTKKDIEEFEAKYKESEEEVGDLKNIYLSSEGDMDVIMETMLCSNQDDESRFTRILSKLIEEGELPDFDNFSKENKKKKAARLKKAKAEAKEAEAEAKKMKLDEGEASLMAAIAQRQASRAHQANDFFSQLEAKYGAGPAKKGGKNSKR